jgi:UDP-N-acetylmuramoyl-tripeptide--D-alanyl-D-alanine ligase
LWKHAAARSLVRLGLRSAASCWRPLLRRTRFVAVTGSLGKTTTKELLAHILSTRRPTRSTLRNQNDAFGVPRSILRVRAGHRFAVIEIGVAGPGEMDARARLVRPHIAVFLGIRRTHANTFSSLDEHAAEKSRLLDHLAEDGICIADGDDPRSAAIAARWPGKRLLFGTTPGLDVVADRIEAEWPQRLRFVLRCGSEDHSVRTRLVGTHWVPSVLAALTTAFALGVPLESAVDVVASDPPFPGRLQPVTLSDGSVILRDDYAASLPTFEVALEALAGARAGRRILVFTDFSDYPGNRRVRLRHLIERLPGRVDHCILVGRLSHWCKRRLADRGLPATGVDAFDTLREAAERLNRIRAPGDLILLKGRTTDHVTRIFFAQFGEVGCWRDDCRKTILCDFCPELSPLGYTVYRRSKERMEEATPGGLPRADHG